MFKSAEGTARFGLIAGTIGGVIGGLAAIAGVLVGGIVSHQSPVSIVFETLGLVIFLLVFFGIFYVAFRSPAKALFKQKNLEDGAGEPAEATILEVHETGVR